MKKGNKRPSIRYNKFNMEDGNSNGAWPMKLKKELLKNGDYKGEPIETGLSLK